MGRATWMPLAELLVLCTAPSGDCEFRSEASSGVPALCHVAGFSPVVIGFPCFLSSLPLSNHLNHHSYPPTFQPLPADPAFPRTTTACGLPKKTLLRQGVCAWNFWTEVKPLLLLLFQLSDFSRGTWHAIRDHVQRSCLIAWDTEPDQLCVPAPFSNLYGKQPSQ